MEAQVREVLRRVLVDEAFLDEMLNNPEQALREYDLTQDERSVLASRERNLLDLMRIGGERRAVQSLFLDLDISLVIDLSEFITSLDLDITIELAETEAARRQEVSRAKIAKLADSVASMRAGADRLERIHDMLQVLSGATELARRSRGQGSGPTS